MAAYRQKALNVDQLAGRCELVGVAMVSDDLDAAFNGAGAVTTVFATL